MPDKLFMPTQPSSPFSHAYTRRHHQPDSSPPGLAQWACYIKASAYGSGVGWTPAGTIHTYIHIHGGVSPCVSVYDDGLLPSNPCLVLIESSMSLVLRMMSSHNCSATVGKTQSPWGANGALLRCVLCTLKSMKCPQWFLKLTFVVCFLLGVLNIFLSNHDTCCLVSHWLKAHILSLCIAVISSIVVFHVKGLSRLFRTVWVPVLWVSV